MVIRGALVAQLVTWWAMVIRGTLLAQSVAWWQWRIQGGGLGGLNPSPSEKNITLFRCFLMIWLYTELDTVPNMP